MPLGKRRRKYLLVLAMVLAGLALVVVTLPVWLPWILRPLAGSQGVAYARYERQGYQRLLLSSVGYTNRGIIIRAGRVEALVPTVWLWRVLVAEPASMEPFVQVRDFDLRLVPAAASRRESSVSREARTVNRTLLTLSRWMPMASVTNGVLHLGTNTVNISAVRWVGGTIDAELQSPRLSAPITLRAARSGPDGYVLHAHSAPLHVDSVVHLAAGAAGASLWSTNNWWSNRVDVQAQFGPAGLLPQTASLAAAQVKVPVEVYRLPGDRELRGSLSAKWENNAFALKLHAEADSAPGMNLPPVLFDLRARGDSEAVTIESASLDSPVLKAQLSREFTVHFTGQVLRQPARLALDADLSRQNWVDVRGRLNGEADLSPGSGQFPQARFHLAGADLSYESFRAMRYEVNGLFDWPQLEVFDALVRMEDGSRASFSGKGDLERRSITGGKVALSGPLLRRWLPEGYGYDSLSLTGRVEGPLTALSHAGQIQITNATTPFLKPLSVSALWSGKGSDLDQLDVLLSNATTSVSLEGTAQVSADRLDIGLKRIGLETNGHPCLELSEPARILATRAVASGIWGLQVPPLELSGEGGRIQVAGEVDWSGEVRLRLGLERLSSQIVGGLVLPPLPEAEISKLNATAAWAKSGPADFSISVAASVVPPVELGSTNRFVADVTAAGDARGLVISNLVVSSETSVVARVEGSLPLTYSPGQGTNPVHVVGDGRLRLSVQTEPGSFLWTELARRTGVSLHEPRLEADVSGTLDKPLGTIKASAAAIVLPKKGARPRPTLEGLQLDLELDPGVARLTHGQLLLQGEPVGFMGELPLGEAVWRDLLRGKLPSLDKAGGRVWIEKAQLAAFEPLFPEWIAPQGDLTLDARLRPGLNLSGRLSLADARTRPLASAGPVRDIVVSLEFRDRLVVLERASANIGAARVNLSGQADLAGLDLLKGELPPFRFSLRGLNVPLARQPEYVVRSDLRLEIIHTNGAPPIITGSARLHDSYYLSDLGALVPGKVASPARRPPYFSIDDPLLADWRLAVDVEGASFLKARGPLFNGELSTNLKLQGTLKEPMVLGDVRVDAGVVRFPFASFRVEQGLVSLTSQDPYHPQVTVNAASKQFSYDIRLNVSGPVDAPTVQFTSNPPLSSEQILLMVSAGELPQGAFTLTSQQRAQTVALFLGRDVLAKIGIGDEGQQRLSIRSGEQLSDQGRPTYQVEYMLDDRWSITGEYDRFGDYNAGFKWRAYSK